MSVGPRLPQVAEPRPGRSSSRVRRWRSGTVQRLAAKPARVGDHDVGRSAIGSALPVDHFLENRSGLI
jgi:hypothetical protein